MPPEQQEGTDPNAPRLTTAEILAKFKQSNPVGEGGGGSSMGPGGANTLAPSSMGSQGGIGSMTLSNKSERQLYVGNIP